MVACGSASSIRQKVGALMKTGAKIGIAAALLGAVGVGAAAIFASRRKAGLSGALGASRFPPVKGRRKSGGMTTTHYRAKKLSIDQRIALLQNLVYEGVQDATLRKLALQITDGCKARDGECEAKAVDAWMRTNIRYTGDIAPIKLGAKGPVEGIDLFQHPKRTVEFRGGDCLPADTQLLNEDLHLVAIKDVKVGQKIWGRDDWTTVVKTWEKGRLPVDRVRLSNGLEFMATSEHKVYVEKCRQHDGICECPADARETARIHVSEVVAGMMATSPKRLRCTKDSLQIGEIVKDTIFVVSIERAVGELVVWDISTEDHYVYLPEADVTVSNCDDHSVLAATLLALNGIPSKFRVTASKYGAGWSHIYVVAGLPKENPGKWVAVDTTLPGNFYGTEAGYAIKRDFNSLAFVKEAVT